MKKIWIYFPLLLCGCDSEVIDPSGYFSCVGVETNNFLEDSNSRFDGELKELIIDNTGKSISFSGHNFDLRPGLQNDIWGIKSDQTTKSYFRVNISTETYVLDYDVGELLDGDREGLAKLNVSRKYQCSRAKQEE